MPGGCVIGHRPIDLHLHALKEMGASISLNQGIVEVDGSDLQAVDIFIAGRHGSTVTGTANAIMAAVLTREPPRSMVPLVSQRLSICVPCSHRWVRKFLGLAPIF